MPNHRHSRLRCLGVLIGACGFRLFSLFLTLKVVHTYPPDPILLSIRLYRRTFCSAFSLYELLSVCGWVKSLPVWYTRICSLTLLLLLSARLKRRVLFNRDDPNGSGFVFRIFSNVSSILILTDRFKLYQTMNNTTASSLIHISLTDCLTRRHLVSALWCDIWWS